MQTQIQPFDVKAFKCADGCRDVAAKGNNRLDKTDSEQIDGFMEVMGALLKLPPEQLERSLAGLDGVTLEGQGDLAASLDDLDQLDLEPSELLQALLRMNAGIEQKSVDADLSPQEHELIDKVQSALGRIPLTEKHHSLLELNNSTSETANSLVQEQNAILETVQAAIEGDIAGASAKNRKREMVSDITAPAGKAAPGENSSAVLDNLATQDGSFQKNNIRKTKEAPWLSSEVEIETDSKSDDSAVFTKSAAHPNRGTAASQGAGPKPDALHSSQINDGLIQKSDLQQSASTNSGTRPLRHEIAHPELDDNPSLRGAAAIAPEDDLDAEKLPKSTFSELNRAASLSRTDLRSESNVAGISENKGMVPTEKEFQADVIRQIVQRMSMHTQGAQSRMVIHLKPEYLGNVHMQVLTENHQVTVRMMADSLAVKEIVEQNLQHLKLELHHHGLEIQKFDVFVGNDSQEWRSGQDQAGFRQALRQRQNRLGDRRTGAKDSAGISAVETQPKHIHKDPNEIDYFV